MASGLTLRGTAFSLVCLLSGIFGQEASADGQAVWNANCANCHGSSPRVRPATLNGAGAKDVIFHALAGGMSSLTLSDSDASDVAGYIATSLTPNPNPSGVVVAFEGSQSGIVIPEIYLDSFYGAFHTLVLNSVTNGGSVSFTSGPGNGKATYTAALCRTGTDTITYHANGNAGNSSNRTFSVKIGDPPAPNVTSSATPVAIVQTPFIYDITVSKCPTLATYATKNLPKWLTLTSKTGRIAGTPPKGTVGPVNFEVSATNAGGTSSVAVVLSISAVVPNVVGLTQAAASTAITNAGLVVGTVTTASSSTVAAGAVISQNPSGGASVASGSSVNFVVSSGVSAATVPNVVGQTQAAASTAITGAGLSVGTVTTASSTTVAAGKVISQNPSGGASVAQGSAVNFVVSSGATVPNVVGLTQAAASTAITGAGLVVGTVTTASSTTVASGKVISQNPSSGASVAPGSNVNLVVSTGATVPNVVGLTQAAASTAITGAGLNVGTVTTASSTTVAAGKVISQNPSSGASVAPGSAVNFVVSSGATVPNVVGLTQAAATTAHHGCGAQSWAR